ncbi:acyl-[acyl-carrier-protein] desaturase 4, chloroplastic-like [Panicum miliaceum]|uniref:Acyl-[acyl-carrier-protein] desaturase 4, chloroplastic-like n=1 Tax=Panicum miliaceum TaxID=4540 RepID=A0A3L6S247_PANMI|nr:acyl-[acyl-carrier-protein] desaturase 4, chloroplastic-like [Panicum miliaceum]
MPGLMTMMALAPSTLSVKRCFRSKETPGTTVLLLTKRSSSSSAHLLRRSWARGAATATATAIRDEQELMQRLDEDGWVDRHLLPLLTPVEEAWQPADLLPSFAASADEQRSKVAELQARAAAVPDDLLVCLVGNMITEEALPTYMSMGNRVAGASDATGCDGHAWARWLRGWTAEENRHGDLLNRYLYLCGRVDMRQVETTVHHLLRRGMRAIPRPSSPYHSLIYGAFQERATFVSHARTAGRASRHGDACLAKICGVIAADERRHEAAYTKASARAFETDPDGLVRALAAVMRAKVTMPGELMTDGRDEHLFDHFSAVAQRSGVYTAADYGDMVEHFVRRWKVAELGADLSGEGRRAQDYVCGLPRKIRRMEELAQDRAAKMEAQSVRFSWVFDRPVRTL